MSTLRLNQIRHEVDYDGTARYELHYIRGSYEARVNVTASVNGGINAQCQTLDADSVMDEILLEEHAEEFVSDHGSAFGEVDLS